MCRDAIVNLLTALPARHEQTLETEAALGSALSASLAALVSTLAVDYNPCAHWGEGRSRRSSSRFRQYNTHYRRWRA